MVSRTKQNILANTVSQGFVTALGIAVVPIYLRLLGPEAYGLVGFLAMLQAWFNLMDMGITATLARETARYQGGALAAGTYRRLVSILERLFLTMALTGGVILFLGAGVVAARWLQVDQLPMAEVIVALRCMAGVVALRWMAGIYRSILTGSERLVWMGAYTSGIGLLRFVGVLPVLWAVPGSIRAFFYFQVCVSAVELLGLALEARRKLPHSQSLDASVSSTLRPLAGFALSIALTGALWALASQTDKLALSRLLPLEHYGYFSLAALAAGGVNVVAGPIGAAILPRLSRLVAEGDDSAVERVYRSASQLVGLVAIPTALTLAFFAQRILFAWTGNETASTAAAPILVFYAIGNGLLVLQGMAYYLQVAKGDMRLHLLGAPLFLALYLPIMLWMVTHFGLKGAGLPWLLSVSLFFMGWLPRIHRRFLLCSHRAWLFDLLLLLLPALGISGGARLLMDRTGWPMDRGAIAALLLLIAFLTLAGTALSSSAGRAQMLAFVRALMGGPNGGRGRRES